MAFVKGMKYILPSPLSCAILHPIFKVGYTWCFGARIKKFMNYGPTILQNSREFFWEQAWYQWSIYRKGFTVTRIVFYFQLIAFRNRFDTVISTSLERMWACSDLTKISTKTLLFCKIIETFHFLLLVSSRSLFVPKSKQQVITYDKDTDPC